MNAELMKIRYLPTPRWTAAVLAAITLIMGVALLITTPADPSEVHLGAQHRHQHGDRGWPRWSSGSGWRRSTSPPAPSSAR